MFELFYLLDKMKMDMYGVIILVHWPKLGGAQMLHTQMQDKFSG
jgi:hypothetical protein